MHIGINVLLYNVYPYYNPSRYFCKLIKKLCRIGNHQRKVLLNSSLVSHQILEQESYKYSLNSNDGEKEEALVN